MESSVRRRRAGTALVVGQFGLIGLCLLPVGPVLFEPGANGAGGVGGVLRVVGLGCLALAVAVGALAFVAMGRDTRVHPVPHARTRLHMHGIYAVIRHPMYAAVLLACLGVTLTTGRLLALLSLAALGVVLHLKAQFEDRLLNEQFGWQFAVYASHVPAFVPRPRRRRRR